MKLYMFMFQFFYLIVLSNSYKLINKPVYGKEELKNEEQFRKENENVRDEDFVAPERVRRIHLASDDKNDETDGDVEGLDKRELEAAKRKMLEEIRSIKSTLKKKFRTVFSQADAQKRKKEFCPVYMSNGADWRKMIREASSLATLLTKAFLGPLGGAQVLGIKAISAIASIGKTAEPTTEFSSDYTKSPNAAIDIPKPTESLAGYSRKTGSSRENSNENGNGSNRRHNQEKRNRNLSSADTKAYIDVDPERYKRNIVRFSEIISDANAFEVLAEVTKDYCN